MKCKACKYPNTEVVKTLHDKDLNTINRRRSCLKCGFRFNTNERIKETDDRFPRVKRQGDSFI